MKWIAYRANVPTIIAPVIDTGSTHKRKYNVANQFIHRSFLVTAVLLIATFTSEWAYAGVYRWVDEDGKINYGDKPPPQSNSAHSLLNSRGLLISDVDRAKTPEQLAEEADLAAQNRKVLVERQKEQHRDNVLLLTFTTERDLLLTRDDRLAAIDSAIQLSERRINGWNTKLVTLDNQIEAHDSADKVPAKLQNDRDQLYRRITSSESYMFDKLEERKRTSDQFEGDLTRYRALKDKD